MDIGSEDYAGAIIFRTCTLDACFQGLTSLLGEYAFTLMEGFLHLKEGAFYAILTGF